jgi:hypothetical protein
MECQEVWLQRCSPQSSELGMEARRVETASARFTSQPGSRAARRARLSFLSGLARGGELRLGGDRDHSCAEIQEAQSPFIPFVCFGSHSLKILEDTAFALAGLGGFNAHGAGFLTAARDCGVKPALITVTSGQIVVLADWLQHKDLKKELIDPALEHNTIAQLAVAFAGDPGVFQPAWLQAIRRWWTPSPEKEKPLASLFDRLLPAQIYVPTRKPADFAKIAQVFNACKDMGIVFNAYNFTTGEAVLFGNKRADELWEKSKAIKDATPSAGIRQGAPKGKELGLRKITPEAVQSALWLSLYGFEHPPQPDLMDGAYLRACIVSELHKFRRVFVARPLPPGWGDHLPRNWFEVQDWQTEMWFSAGYKAEVDTLLQINGLIADKHLDPTKFKEVNLIEISPTRPAGYFHYFIERESVFDGAYDKSVAAFEAEKVCQKKTPSSKNK